MAGAVDALEVGSAIFNRGEIIVAACPRFAELSGRRPSDMPGLALKDLVQPDDQAAARWFLSQFWKDGTPITFVAKSRRPDGRDFLAESHVVLLSGAGGQVGLILARRFKCRDRGPEVDTAMVKSKAVYIIDMAQQLATMASGASMPVTCDLFDVTALAGLRESGLGPVDETPA